MVLKITVMAPDKVICTSTADEIILPGLTGQVGILGGHIPLMTSLDTGLLKIKLDQKWTPILLCGGIAQVNQDSVIVLVNEVEDFLKIDLKEATEALETATLELQNVETSKERLDASIKVKKALATVEGIKLLS